MQSANPVVLKPAHSFNPALPLYWFVLIKLYRLMASAITYAHVFFIRKSWMGISKTIRNAPVDYCKTIETIWQHRMLRRTLSFLLKTPLRNKTNVLIDNQLTLPNEGCIIVLPHTAWAKVLAHWCSSQNYALVLAGGPWIKRTGNLNVPGGGFKGLRKLVKHLEAKKHVVIIGDNVNRFRCCMVNYLGKETRAALLPARLAAVANAPMHVVIPQFENNHVILANGLHLEASDIKQNKQKAIQQIFSYFEYHIYTSPAIYYPNILGSLSSSLP